MPDETLITQLDTLRENYTQQQRAAAALQGALKGVTNAHIKAQKTLRDLSAQKAGIPGGAVTGALDAFTESRLKEEAIDPLLPDIRRELKTLATLTGAL